MSTTIEDEIIDQTLLNNNYYIDSHVFGLGLILSVIGISGFLRVVWELDGIRNTLIMGQTIRATSVDSSLYLSPIGMIGQTLSVFVTGGCLCLFCSKKKLISHNILFWLSFVFSILYLLFNSGRSTLLVFVACFVFYIFKKMNFKISWLVLFAFLLLIITSSSLEMVMVNIANGRDVFFNINYSLANNIVATVSDLSYPYANVLNANKLTDYMGYRYGIEYITWILEVLPERMLNMVGIYLPAYKNVTVELSSYYISVMGWNGGTPTDFVTCGLLQFNIMGLIINTLITIGIIKYFDRIFLHIPGKYYPLLVRFCFFGYSLITSNDMTMVVYSNFYLLIIGLFISKWGMTSTNLVNKHIVELNGSTR